MIDPAIEREIRELKERLARLEARVGLGGLRAESEAQRVGGDVSASAEMGMLPPPLKQVAPPTAPVGMAPPTTPQGIAPPIHPYGQRVSPVVVPARAVSPKPVKAVDGGSRASVELMIGGRWAAWVGALVVVLAGIFFVAWGYERGLWTGMPALARCVILAGFGLLLIGAGEVVLRRVGRAAAVGLMAAGVGMLYVTAFASHYLGLVGSTAVIGLLVPAALVGLGFTLRVRSLTIGVLSILGGYVTPVILAAQVGHPPAMMAHGLYLSMLLAIVLGLSAASAQPFRTLRSVGAAFHGVVGGGWLLVTSVNSPQAWTALMLLLGLWWAMVIAEATLAAVRQQSAKANAIITLLTTAWFVTLGCALMWRGPVWAPEWVGAFLMCTGVIAALIAIQFGSGLEALQRRPRDAVDALTISLWAQFAVLSVVAAAAQFDGWSHSVAWLAIALAAVEVGRRLRSRPVDVFGLIVGALATAKILVIDWQLFRMGTALWSMGGSGAGGAWLEISPWILLLLVNTGAVIAASFRLRGEANDGWGAMSVLLCCGGALLWAVAWLAVTRVGLVETAGWTAGAALLIVLHGFGQRQCFMAVGIGLLAMAAAKWFAVDALAARAARGFAFDGMRLVFNGQMLVAVLIAGVFMLAGRLLRDTSGMARELAGGLRLAGWLVVLFGLSFEVDRWIGGSDAAWMTAWQPWQRRVLWLSLLWGAAGTAMVMVMAQGGGRGGWMRVAAIGGWVILLLSVATWLFPGTLFPRLERGPALVSVVFNVQFATGLLLTVMLVIASRITVRLTSGEGVDRSMWNQLVMVGAAAVAVMGLWLGSLEIDRYFAPEWERWANAAMTRQVGLSVYWGVYGMVLVGVGLLRRWPAMRYAGLALIGLTLVKFLLIDMASVSAIYRALTLLVVGLLLLVTSIAYVKLASRLTGGEREESEKRTANSEQQR